MTDVQRSIALVGATGLIGNECLRLLLEHPAYSRVVVLTRRAVSVPDPAGKLQQHVVEFDRLNSYGTLFAVDRVLCALGTTIGKAGSQAAFRKVDFEYPCAAAQLGLPRRQPRTAPAESPWGARSGICPNCVPAIRAPSMSSAR